MEASGKTPPTKSTRPQAIAPAKKIFPTLLTFPRECI